MEFKEILVQENEGEGVALFTENEKEIHVYFELKDFKSGWNNGEGDFEDNQFSIEIEGAFLVEDGEEVENIILTRTDKIHLKYEIKENLEL